VDQLSGGNPVLQTIWLAALGTAAAVARVSNPQEVWDMAYAHAEVRGLVKDIALRPLSHQFVHREPRTKRGCLLLCDAVGIGE
jgi:hypothetical protein